MDTFTPLRLMSVSVVRRDWTVARTSTNHFNGAVISPWLFFGWHVRIISIVVEFMTRHRWKNLIWFYFVCSRALVVCATTKRSNHSVCLYKIHDCGILEIQTVDVCKYKFLFILIFFGIFGYICGIFMSHKLVYGPVGAGILRKKGGGGGHPWPALTQPTTSYGRPYI